MCRGFILFIIIFTFLIIYNCEGKLQFSYRSLVRHGLCKFGSVTSDRKKQIVQNIPSDLY